MQHRTLTVAWVVGIGLIALGIIACRQASPALPSPTASLQLRSPAFAANASLPMEATCDGADRSPALAWSDPPAGTQAFALLVDDPDAPNGVFIHWILFNIPATSRSLPAGLPADAVLPDGSRQGKNDFGHLGYNGPCPPPGPAHHYRFTLWALDQPLDLQPGADRAAFLAAVQRHALASGQLVGLYQRQRARVS